MFDQIITAMVDSIRFAFHVLIYCLQQMPGAAQFIVGMFVVFLSYRFFLVPLVHGDVFSMASQRASRAQKENMEKRSS